MIWDNSSFIIIIIIIIIVIIVVVDDRMWLFLHLHHNIMGFDM
jgi:hypothetical protein